MALPRTVCDVIAEHVAFEVECVDRMYLNVYPSSRYALGIHIDPATITYVLLDLSGDVFDHMSEQTGAMVEPDRVIDDMIRALDMLVGRSGIDRDRIVGVGIASPGPIDAVGGVVVDPPHLAGWHRVRLRDRLHEATGLPVPLAKDVTAAAVAERWAGAAVGARGFVFVYLVTGVGMGVVADDIVVRGMSGNAGTLAT